MTKTEFYEYIKSFGKNPGEYTDDEIYDICVAHKDLISGKSWREVVDLLGVDKSPDALRSWTFRRQEADGTARKNTMCLSDKTVSELTGEEFEDTVQTKLDELYVEKQKVRDSYNAYRRTLREEARVQSMMDSITTAIASLDKLPRVAQATYKPSDKEAVLLLSDLHIGVECNNYYNTYNTDVAANRLATLAAKTVSYCKTNAIKKLNILNLGDMIHGLIHTSARLEQELDVTEQIMVASELLAEFLNIMQKAAPEVTYRSVTDNHSRAIANLKEHIEKENFCKLIDWFLAERLKDTNIEFINDNIDDGIGMFTLDCGKTVMFSHGHQDSLNQSMQNYIGLTKEWVDYILLAHYHNPKCKEFQGCTVVVNGSIVGTEQYAFSKRLFSEPSQTLLVFDDEDTQNIKISLN